MGDRELAKELRWVTGLGAWPQNLERNILGLWLAFLRRLSSRNSRQSREILDFLLGVEWQGKEVLGWGVQ